MRKMWAFLITALLGLLLTQGLQAAPSLQIGDSAPAMKVARWVKGQPVEGFSKGRVYVVEFWATWCGPCLESIPHLTQMAQKYRGKVTFAGISVWESQPGDDSTAYMDNVVAFVKKMGDKMDYNIGVDSVQGTMARTWLSAAGEYGIPSAFVIGKDNKIAWIGHPMAGLEDVLDKVLADKFDSMAYAAERAKAKAEEVKRQAEQVKIQKLFRKPMDLYQKGDYKAGLTELNKILAANPQYENQVAYWKFHLLLKADEKQAYPFAKRMAAGAYKDNLPALNDMAWSILDDKAQLTAPDYATALAIARQAADVSKNEDPAILDTLAYAYYKKGEADRAIATEEKAIKLLDKMSDVPDTLKQDLAAHLATFKKK